MLLTSGSGMGRSRFLSACLLDAKMQGALVLCAVAVNGEAEFSLMRVLGLSLLQLAPELAERAASCAGTALSQILPELDTDSPSPENSKKVERASAMEAMRALLVAVARERCLIIAVDDFHRVDEPSAACLALLAREADKHRLLIAADRKSVV